MLFLLRRIGGNNDSRNTLPFSGFTVIPVAVLSQNCERFAPPESRWKLRSEARGHNMKVQRRFGWLLAALLVVATSAGNVWAQDESVGNAPVMQYPEARTTPAQYPDSGNNAPPQQYPDAQQYPNGGNNGPGQVPPQDPSGRVARLQYTSGEVSMQPGGVNDWVAASLNRPLTTADRVWTDKNSRAELNVGDGFLRMNSETSVTLTNVSDSTVQVELDQGVLEVTVKHLEKGEIYRD